MDISDSMAHNMFVGLVLGLIGSLAMAIRALLKSRSEGARRVKIVGGIALLLLIGSVLVSLFGPVGALGIGVVAAAIYWVARGFRKAAVPDSASAQSESAAPYFAQPDLPEQRNLTDAPVDRKTVISCLRCGGRLRVQAGKYIDVTCPHCKTVFRTHT